MPDDDTLAVADCDCDGVTDSDEELDPVRLDETVEVGDMLSDVLALGVRLGERP